MVVRMVGIHVNACELKMAYLGVIYAAHGLATQSRVTVYHWCKFHMV